MNRGVLGLAVGILLGVVGMASAWHDEKEAKKEKDEPARQVASCDIVEKLDGKESRATAVVVTVAPGHEGTPHRHPGPAFGYVLEGEYEWAINDEPSRVLKVGDTFYEPAGSLHRVSKNPGKVKARFLAWLLHPRDAKSLVVPEPPK